MLLTGDALGDDMLQFLDRAGTMRHGAMHVDLLKLPHHGSVRNISKPPDFFERLTADYYVISADGTNGNPDIPMLQKLTEARGAADYAIHLTNREDRLTAFFEEDKAKDRHYEVEFRASSALAIAVELDGGR